jgi:hypothetical protein
VRLGLILAVAITGVGCSRGQGAPAQTCAGRETLAEGLVVDKVPVGGKGCMILARVDPRRYRLRVLTAAEDGETHSVIDWAAKYKLVAVTNSSMFGADPQGRSIGMLVSGEVANNKSDNPQLGGFLAFDPVDAAADAPVAFFGRPCAGFDLEDIKKRYRSIVQNYRILECDGSAGAWKDTKVHSSAAVAQDKDGNVVFVHVRTPLRVAELAKILADPAHRITAAHYVEGGPEASLYVRAGKGEVRAIGSFETGFFDDSNLIFWPLPNVLGFEPR